MKNKAFHTLTTALLFFILFGCKNKSEVEELNKEIEDFLKVSVDDSKYADSTYLQKNTHTDSTVYPYKEK